MKKYPKTAKILYYVNWWWGCGGLFLGVWWCVGCRVW